MIKPNNENYNAKPNAYKIYEISGAFISEMIQISILVTLLKSQNMKNIQIYL